MEVKAERELRAADFPLNTFESLVDVVHPRTRLGPPQCHPHHHHFCLAELVIFLAPSTPLSSSFNIFISSLVSYEWPELSAVNRTGRCRSTSNGFRNCLPLLGLSPLRPLERVQIRKSVTHSDGRGWVGARADISVQVCVRVCVRAFVRT